jgi:IclR family acetate operon transcriptional repressor
MAAGQRDGAVASVDQKSYLTLSTLDKGLHILEVLAGAEAADGLTLTELSRVLGMHRTTLLRFLATLRARGYVDRDPESDRYRLGMHLLSLVSVLLSGLDVRQQARPYLRALRDRTQEMVHLAVLDHSDVLSVERIDGRQPLSLQTGIGARRPAYCSASGKAILAHLADDELDPILASGMPPVTARTITSVEAMREHLVEVRRHGYAIDDEERIEGVRCVAAPVFGYEQRVLAAVSIAAPALRLPDDRVSELGEEVRKTAEAVSRRLGYPESINTIEAFRPSVR